MFDVALPWLIRVQLVVTLYLCGVIWVVQLVHYPLFARVGRGEFVRYEQEHVRRMGWVVAGPMLVELAVAGLLVAAAGGMLAWIGAGLVGLIWLSTWAWQVPAHRVLERGFDAGAHRRLVRSNWLRTAAWSIRAVISLLFVHG